MTVPKYEEVYCITISKGRLLHYRNASIGLPPSRDDQEIFQFGLENAY